MTFYGAAEPLAYFTGIYGTPLGVTAETPEAYRLAFRPPYFTGVLVVGRFMH